MISRRILRIKALMALYAFNRRDDSDVKHAEYELFESIDKAYDLYHYLLLLVIEIGNIANEKIEQALQKRLPTLDDLNPKEKFSNNQVIEQLKNNKALNSYKSERNLSWANNSHIPRILYSEMINWEVYTEYMKSEESTYVSDRKFIINIITGLFANSEELLSSLEEQSIYWNDDVEYISSMVGKTLKKIKIDSDEDMPLMPLFKNEEDSQFVKILFRKTIINSEKYSSLIDKHTTNWEVDRIALMDILVMQLAITEIVEFPEIPVKVSLNEYIEIAKYYCTSKSSTFVNGILDNIVREIREEGRFVKFGRGLMGESLSDKN